eukprot:1149142-Pelagomonas_calceolata.AAC.2
MCAACKRTHFASRKGPPCSLSSQERTLLVEAILHHVRTLYTSILYVGFSMTSTSSYYMSNVCALHWACHLQNEQPKALSLGAQQGQHFMGGGGYWP